MSGSSTSATGFSLAACDPLLSLPSPADSLGVSLETIIGCSPRKFKLIKCVEVRVYVKHTVQGEKFFPF